MLACARFQVATLVFPLYSLVTRRRPVAALSQRLHVVKSCSAQRIARKAAYALSLRSKTSSAYGPRRVLRQLISACALIQDALCRVTAKSLSFACAYHSAHVVSIAVFVVNVANR